MNRSYWKNDHPETIIVSVDSNGNGPGDETFATRANPEHVISDYVWEMPVVVSMPDGTLTMGTRLVFTTAGIAAGISA